MIRSKRAFYRKKPISIEAFQWLGHDPEEPDHLIRYFRDPDVIGNRTCDKCTNKMNDHGWIDTLEGGHIVCPGDWVIRGVAGEYYPCKPDIFDMTYDKVEGHTDE